MILFGSYLPDPLNVTSNLFPVPVLAAIGSLVIENYIPQYLSIKKKCSFNPQDGIAVSYARRESDESALAESEGGSEAAGKYPVLVVEGANHAQVASGDN